MSNTTLSNLLIKIKNANSINCKFIKVPLTKFTLHLLNNLKLENFITDYYQLNKKKEILINLKSKKYIFVIQYIEQISKPGLKKYITLTKIKNLKINSENNLISTSNGILDSKQAKIKKIGGELLFKII